MLHNLIARMLPLLGADALGRLVTSVREPQPEQRRLRRHLRGTGKPGKSPALSGRHSEPQIHIRGRSGTHYWFTQARWDKVKKVLTFLPGDVIEYVDGYGAVTKRTRVPL